MATKTVPLDHEIIVPVSALEYILIARLAQVANLDGEDFVRQVLADGVRHELLSDLREEVARRLRITGDVIG